MLISQMGLIPLRNFGRINGAIYRGEQPHGEKAWEWLLHVVGVSAVISFRENVSDLGYIEKMPAIKHYRQICVPDHQPPTLWQALDFTGLIQQFTDDGLVTYIHCEHGHGRTSIFSVIAKIALGWNPDDALEDEKRRFHVAYTHPVQEKWVRDFVKQTDALQSLNGATMGKSR